MTARVDVVLTPGARPVEVDTDPARIGLTRRVDVGIQGGARTRGRSRGWPRGREGAGGQGWQARLGAVARTESRRAQELSSMDHEQEKYGIAWSARARRPERMSSRRALREIVSGHVDHGCSIPGACSLFEAGRTHLASGPFGSCGRGLPALSGAKVGTGDVPGVSFAGDQACGIPISGTAAHGRGDRRARKRSGPLRLGHSCVGAEPGERADRARAADEYGLRGPQGATAGGPADAPPRRGAGARA